MGRENAKTNRHRRRKKEKGTSVRYKGEARYACHHANRSDCHLVSLSLPLNGHHQLWPLHGERNAWRESSRFGHVEVVIQRWPPLFSHFCFLSAPSVHSFFLFFHSATFFFSSWALLHHFPWCLRPWVIVIKTWLYACLQPALLLWWIKSAPYAIPMWFNSSVASYCCLLSMLRTK